MKYECPYCKEKLTYFQKFFLFSYPYHQNCPFCHKQLKMRPLGQLARTGIFLLTVVVMISFATYANGQYSYITDGVLILYIFFSVIGTHFVKLVPAEGE